MLVAPARPIFDSRKHAVSERPRVYTTFVPVSSGPRIIFLFSRIRHRRRRDATRGFHPRKHGCFARSRGRENRRKIVFDNGCFRKHRRRSPRDTGGLRERVSMQCSPRSRARSWRHAAEPCCRVGARAAESVPVQRSRHAGCAAGVWSRYAGAGVQCGSVQSAAGVASQCRAAEPVTHAGHGQAPRYGSRATDVPLRDFQGARNPRRRRGSPRSRNRNRPRHGSGRDSCIYTPPSVRHGLFAQAPARKGGPQPSENPNRASRRQAGCFGI